MTQAQFKAKIKECLKADKASIVKLIDKAIVSGSIDLKGADNNYLLPKSMLAAIYGEMSRQYMPFTKEGKKEAAKIGRYL